MGQGDSESSDGSGLEDRKRERRLIRKIDLHIVPFVVLLYLFSFLDRVNIGNARLYGMEEDLDLVGDQYQVAVSILFVTYCIFEVPSNLVIKKLKPSRYIASISVIWGIIATLTGITQNYGGLIACRIILGVVEAGLFPGLVTYLTLFYSKREIALRTGYLFSSAAIAGAFGGLLAYGIGFMDGIAGLRGWRWIMILEGIPTVIIGIVTWFFLADEPDTAYYLNDEERALVVRLRRRDVGQTASAQKFHWADVKEGALDWRIYVFCIGQFGVDTMLYGYSTFLPTIIKGMGKWTTPEVQALTIPCYAVGAIAYLVTAWASDRIQRRGIFICIFAVISVVGYGILISDSSSGVHYFGALLIALGLYVTVGLPLAWLPTTLPRYGKRTFATGLQLTFGNISGVMSPFLYKTDEAPRYVRGNAVTLSLVGFAGSIYGLMWWYYHMKNKRREQGLEDDKVAGLTEEEIEEMGDRSPRFSPIPSPISDDGWNLHHHLGGYGPWVEKPDGVDEAQKFDQDGCMIDQLHMMARHAARYPTKSAGRRHLALLSRIKETGVSLNGSLSFLNNWTYITDDPASDFEQLTTTGPYNGISKAFSTGMLFAARYGHLIPEESSIRFWASDSQRVINTAEHFASGYFGFGWKTSGDFHLEVIPETFDRRADTLTPGDSCLRYIEDADHGHDAGSQMLELFQQTYIPVIAERLVTAQDNLALGSLTNWEVFSMQEMCGFEITTRGWSPWCDVFTREDWENFEYARDLVHYYRGGPGNPYAGAMGWLWLNATAELLRAGPDAGTLFFSFVHDGDIAPFLTALDILRDSKYDPSLPVTHVAKDRVWRTSTVLPMGARVNLERMTCSSECGGDPDSEGTYIRVNINDKIVPLPYCKSGPGLSCPLAEFLGHVERRRGEVGEFKEDESRNPRRAPEETGPFGKRRNARYEQARSRTRTGTPATKRENPNVAEFGRLFAQQQEDEKARSNTLPKSSSSSNLDAVRKQQATEKVATECILYGYKNKDSEWKVLDKYERISKGVICEDYPRTDPLALGGGQSQLLSGGDVVIHANLSADANRKSKRYAGGFHWIKVTFDSTTAADRACFYSPQDIDGHVVFCELYHGQGPAEDVPILHGSAEAARLRAKASRTLTTSHSTNFLQSQDKDRHTLPRSFAMNNLATVADVDEGATPESTLTASSATMAAAASASGVDQPGGGGGVVQQRNVSNSSSSTQPRPESEFMTHIPTVRRTKLRPMTEALPPQPTVTERVLRSIPILSWFTGDIVGDGPQLREDGAFDYDKSNTYWRFWYMVDMIIGTDICGLKEES
ncbi:phosphoglycerate mutase-like protein [Aspergillus heteromorphus CBS 117.55]|uniref:Phosphoglycerate mutase-like protein n=1 Tax=Aspergillus heteromorphus CBS 117.55 TaxID=1448321 RepID=A0A317WA96_9EURO|nr:phosphoglycerate mutase-like protein [Aspergillus heteromorphus CBS 117.55]PWY83454.1 phosphoglycerate mutase-like protein [Aspergillus heteromorphus CBS 117.55]